ncbi:VOC family protein [Streptomyces sp. ODS28]|uniref:VOC family protein n=1 Tax=Streptomyces sp. ODS28 TaxID=3136688 RepID=UPI0031E63292
MTEAADRDAYEGHALGTPCWASLMVHDLAAAREFYRRLFGWEFRDGPQQLGPYVRGTVNGRAVAGLGEMPAGRSLHVAWLPYFASPDADRTASLVRECGGTVGVGPLDAEEAGRMAIASDPAGAPFGVWQAGEHVGAGPGGGEATGTPVWYELVVPDSAVAAAFYPMAFGHSAEESKDDAGDVVVLRVDGVPVAGIRGMGSTLPRGRGPHWTTYFTVEDPDATARLAAELGGRVLEPPQDGPMGRYAELADPEGAEFTVTRWKRSDG